MKKLLIFMLVLGMVSAANATLSLYLDGSPATDPTIVTGETLVIQIYSDDTTNWLGYTVMSAFELTGTGVGSVGNGQTLAAGGDMGSLLWFTGFGDGGYELTTADAPAGGGTTVSAGVQHTMDFSSSLQGITRISLYDDRVGGYGDSATGADYFDITVIPEPATIALLGLGGLFLARRRRRG